MAQIISDKNDIEFVLYEQMEFEKLFKTKKYKALNRKMSDMVISEIRNFAVKEIYPTYKESDRNGASYENGRVKVPECFYNLHKKYVESEWIALTQSQEYGGQELPYMLAQVVWDYVMGANYSFSMLGVLANGAGKLIELGASEEIKKLYLEKVYTGRWAATMLLTEPNAGSDVGALTTTAKKRKDGTYTLKGNKIFISYGDHDLTENIIHPVLARVEGAPMGSKGISLFLVPKYLVNIDGSIGEFNNIVCTGIEKKMGLHGSPTCSMSLGEQGECRGFLLGEENKGLNMMFFMINDVRLEVGMQALGHASTAYLHAAKYASERMQGREPRKKENCSSQVPIIRHPDVRRMLLGMKSYTEGMRSFVYYISKCMDIISITENPNEKKYLRKLINFLTPILKAYNSSVGFDVCVQALQVFGGYGYTQDYPVEQIVRDCKICSIYEGTEGIQAIDLLLRKLGMDDGNVLKDLDSEMQKTISSARNIPCLKNIAKKVEIFLEEYIDTSEYLKEIISSEKYEEGYAFAVPYLFVSGELIISWMLLWRAVVSINTLIKMKDKTVHEQKSKNGPKMQKKEFYEGQIKSAEYFIDVMLPITRGKLEGIRSGNKAIIEISESAFAG